MSIVIGTALKIICCCSCLVTIIICIIIGIIIGYVYHDDISEKLKIALLEITQDKCKEYVNVACSFQTFPPPKSSSDQNGGNTTRWKTVPQGMLPHQAYLEFPRKSNSEKIIICSGSLVSEKFILTAAHCVDDANLREGMVLLGTLDRSESNSTQRKRIKKAYIHSDYTNGKFAADICLLELEENVKFSSNVRPICLNTKLDSKYDSIIASGWGITEDGSNSKHLNMADLHNHAYINKETEASCRSYFEQEYETLHEMGICLANLTEGINQGYDNGGPLQVKLHSKCQNTWEQIGITSVFAKNDHVGKALNLQLFVKVEYFFPWIANIVWPVLTSIDDESRIIIVS